MDAQERVSALRQDGFSDTQIKDYLCDGEALSRSDLDQETVEEMYDIVNNQGEKMPVSKFYIKAEYCYSRGTFGAPEDGVWHDPETGQQVWDTREDAQSVVDQIDSTVYYLNHGEQGRPNLKVRKLRSNQDIVKYLGDI